MDREEVTERLINLAMPIAAAGYVFLLTLFVLLYAMDKYIFKLDTGGPLLLPGFFCFLIFGAFYCFKYLKLKLGYFLENDRILRHIVVLILLPVILGSFMAFKFYKSKESFYKTPPHTEK